MARRFWSILLIGFFGFLCACAEDDGGFGADDDDTTSSGDVVLSDVDVVDTENPLMCKVRWTSSVPLTSTVHFGEVSFDFSVGTSEFVTEHEVVVYGLKPERTYRLRPVSYDDAGNAYEGQELTYTTGPVDFPKINVEITVTDQDTDFWVLLNLSGGDSNPDHTAVAIVDALDGEFVWFKLLSTFEGRLDVEATYLEDEDVILIGGGIPGGICPNKTSLDGEEICVGPAQPEGLMSSGSIHHTFQKLGDDRYLTLFYEAGESGVHDVVRIVQAQGDAWTTEWEWSAEEVEDDGIYAYGNRSFLDESEGAVFFNSLMNGALYKIDKQSRQVVWRLGEGGDFTNTSATDHLWFTHTHGAERLANGHFLFFDNGSEDWGSRAVEYGLNEESMTVEILWEYPGNTPNYFYGWAGGDVDFLEDDRTFIGATVYGDPCTEVLLILLDEDDDPVWEMNLSTVAGGPLNSYAVQKLPVLVSR